MKNRKIGIFTALNLIIMTVFTVALLYCMKLQNNMKLTIHFGESHAETQNIAQLFYAGKIEEFSENSVLTEVFEDDVVTFNISAIDFKKNVIRIDPFNEQIDFSVARLDVGYGEITAFSLNGVEFADFIEMVHDIEYEVESENLVSKATGADIMFMLNREFSDELCRYNVQVNRAQYIIIGILFVLLGLLLVKLFIPKQENEIVRSYLTIMIILDIFIAAGVLLFYTLFYFENHFGQVPFGQLLYHLHTPLDGTDISSYTDAIRNGIIVTVLVFCVVLWLYVLLKRKRAHRGYMLWCGVVGLMLFIYVGVRGCKHFDLIDYYKYTHESTNLYEEYYVDGREVNLTFPEKKRNLVYIYLESMEITFADTGTGGAMQDNYIPELTELALENGSFSSDNVLNGAYHVSGATYTMGALAAQTAGVPISEILVSNATLNSTWESENNYLPGVWSIGDILAQEGYNQEFLIGSEGAFAGRSSYFKGHGDYAIVDYNVAVEMGRIPSDYRVWWGYEDEKLFAFAKEDITKLVSMNQPFNLTLLTADTHAAGGYVCDLCQGEYANQYSNVFACSSRQVSEFIEWIQQQDFYENTTIVLSGDHLTMDSYYIDIEGAEGYDRRMYFSIINAADGKEYTGQKRLYTTLDLFPTTLSGLGVSIEGNRLGLGVDLYSDTPTLVEEYGLEYLNTELLKNSEYYNEKLLYK